MEVSATLKKYSALAPQGSFSSERGARAGRWMRRWQCCSYMPQHSAKDVYAARAEKRQSANAENNLLMNRRTTLYVKEIVANEASADETDSWLRAQWSG